MQEMFKTLQNSSGRWQSQWQPQPKVLITSEKPAAAGEFTAVGARKSINSSEPTPLVRLPQCRLQQLMTSSTTWASLSETSVWTSGCQQADHNNSETQPVCTKQPYCGVRCKILFKDHCVSAQQATGLLYVAAGESIPQTGRTAEKALSLNAHPGLRRAQQDGPQYYRNKGRGFTLEAELSPGLKKLCRISCPDGRPRPLESLLGGAPLKLSAGCVRTDKRKYFFIQRVHNR